MKAVFFIAQLNIQGAAPVRHYLDFFHKTIAINKHYFSKTILYTTLGTPIDPSIGVDLIIPLFSVHHQFMHYMRVLSWLKYVESALFDCDTLLMDADVVMNRPCDEIFQNDFAVAFSLYNTVNFDLPFRAGVIFLKHTQKQRICFHMKQILAIAERKIREKETRFGFKDANGTINRNILSGHWGLDERAIIAYIQKQGVSLKEIEPQEFVKITDDISVFGDYYNFSCKEHMPLEWPSASILHFTGLSKPSIDDYCRKLNELTKPA